MNGRMSCYPMNGKDQDAQVSPVRIRDDKDTLIAQYLATSPGVSRTSEEDETLLGKSSNGSDEVNVTSLTLKLLSSPENLDFAMEHQQVKIIELKQKLATLLGLENGDKQKDSKNGNVNVSSATSFRPEDRSQPSDNQPDKTIDSHSNCEMAPVTHSTKFHHENSNPTNGLKFHHNSTTPIQQVSVQEPKQQLHLSYSDSNLLYPSISPIITPASTPISSSLNNGHSQSTPAAAMGLVTRPNPSITSSLQLEGAMMKLNQGTMTRVNKRHRAQGRSKNKQREKYIQLPPTFKYPEPIDISSLRVTAATAQPKPASGSTVLQQLTRQSLFSNPHSFTSLGKVVAPRPEHVHNNTLTTTQPLTTTATSELLTKLIPSSTAAAVRLDSGSLNIPTVPFTVNLPITGQVPSHPTTVLANQVPIMPVTGTSQILNTVNEGMITQQNILRDQNSDSVTNSVIEVTMDGGMGHGDMHLHNNEEEMGHSRPVCPKHVMEDKSQCRCPGTNRLTQWRRALELSKARRCRTKIEPSMLHLLESKYSDSHFVSPYERKKIADMLGITERAVIYWFQNRRRKDIKNLNNMEPARRRVMREGDEVGAWSLNQHHDLNDGRAMTSSSSECELEASEDKEKRNGQSVENSGREQTVTVCENTEKLNRGRSSLNGELSMLTSAV